jgi:hypothetical protein
MDVLVRGCGESVATGFSSLSKPDGFGAQQVTSNISREIPTLAIKVCGAMADMPFLLMFTL